MSENHPTKPPAKKKSWSFIPTDDVRELVNAELAKVNGLTKTELINQAVMDKFPEALLRVAEREVEEQRKNLEKNEKLIRLMRAKLKGTH